MGRLFILRSTVSDFFINTLLLLSFTNTFARNAELLLPRGSVSRSNISESIEGWIPSGIVETLSNRVLSCTNPATSISDDSSNRTAIS